jgi:ribosomal protein L37E
LTDAPEAAPGATRQEDKGPPCKRCGQTAWDVQTREKNRLRWALETLLAAPDVWIYQSESGGWPGKTYELWTCRNCGRRARVAPKK